MTRAFAKKPTLPGDFAEMAKPVMTCSKCRNSLRLPRERVSIRLPHFSIFLNDLPSPTMPSTTIAEERSGVRIAQPGILLSTATVGERVTVERVVPRVARIKIVPPPQ